MREKLKYYIITAIISSFLLVCTVFGAKGIKLQEAEAAVKQEEIVNMRIIGTTDLHGQLNSKDYEQGINYNNGGLARIFPMIKEIRSELPKENSLTVDAGDVLYDYTTEYIFAENPNALQPIYQAMAQVGYDAITLGNHDFDYGYDYIKSQLKESGLQNIAVVSNVTDSKTGEHPFLENMLLTRTMKTDSGKKVEIKVGIIGQTIPVFASKTQSYTGILKAEDIVTSTQTQAKKLKEMGADIIVVIAHSGIGPEVPELNFKNVSYALTKIPEVDVIVCGHEHNLYPTTDSTSPYLKLPGVDKKTFLMNGKNVIMAGDRGEAVGVVDLTLKISGNEVKIANRKSELRKVTAKNTVEDSSIASAYGAWEDELLNYSTDVIGTLKDGELIHNYFGLVSDSSAIQLLNDAKMNYALNYVTTTGKEYQKYPIVAVSNYAGFVTESIDNFVHIEDGITEAHLSEIQPYNDYLYLYTITGKQLREWLEWTASAYETLSVETSWSGGIMTDLMLNTKIKSLIREEWLDDWNNYYIFDGVDYVIDPEKEPRYDISGNKINDTRRIKNLVYNGKIVMDDMVFLLASNKITQPSDANKGVDKQVVLNGFNRSQKILSDYVELLSAGKSIIPQVDNNWRIDLPKNYKFLMKAPSNADGLIRKTNWYVNSLLENNQYQYYTASFVQSTKDTQGPHIIVTQEKTNATASPYKVAVSVSDASEIKAIRYMEGDYDVNSNGWPYLSNMTTNSFTVRENGTYSIYAEDILGNKTVTQIIIKNINEYLLGTPIVNTYTNRKSAITGTAEPNTTIIFETNSGTYESKVDISGKFSYALPSQASGTIVYVSVRDESRGLESERLAVTVKRTGPNRPTVNPITNTDEIITGITNDDDATVIAICGDIVYVSKDGGKELFEKNTEIYNVNLEIIETKVELSNGSYKIQIPSLIAGETVTIYNMDHLSRNSKATSAKITETGPNTPIVYEVSNIEKSLNGSIPSPDGKQYQISLVIGSNTYETESEKDGSFTFPLEEQLRVGQILKVTASDTQNGSIHYSRTVEVEVMNIDKYIVSKSTNLMLEEMNEKSFFISGTCLDTSNVFIAIATGSGKSFQNTLLTLDTDNDGSFQYSIEDYLKEGTKIYALSRFTDGEILIAAKTVVIPGAPDAPILLKDVTNADKQVRVIANKDCEIVLKIGTKTYRSSDVIYDTKTKKYIYTIKTDRANSGAGITITAINSTGIGDETTSTVVMAAPDSPKINTVNSGDKVITGTMDYLDSETKAIAQIGKKTYEGVVDENGKYKITIPKQSSGTSILVWGTNKAGRGPMNKAIVVK